MKKIEKLYGDAYGIFDASIKKTKKAEKALVKFKEIEAQKEREVFTKNDIVINNF